jgi:hypothetical protein
MPAVADRRQVVAVRRPAGAADTREALAGKPVAQLAAGVRPGRTCQAVVRPKGRAVQSPDPTVWTRFLLDDAADIDVVEWCGSENSEAKELPHLGERDRDRDHRGDRPPGKARPGSPYRNDAGRRRENRYGHHDDGAENDHGVRA